MAGPLLEMSGGSACSSGAARPSHVLRAIGESPDRTALLRASLGRGTTEDDIERAVQVIVPAVQRALRVAVYA